MPQRVVIITGCSTGVGLGTAVFLANDAQKQYKVYACMRNLAKKEQLVTKAAHCVDKTLFVVQMDVCSEASVADAVKQVLDKEGRVDVLINNAGVGLMGALEYQKMENITSLFDTNVHGVIRCIRAVLPTMKQQLSGHIINVSSIIGLIAYPFNAVYCASKFALEGLSESMAPVLAQFNIRLTVINPGPIKTAFADTVESKEIGGMETGDERTKQLVSKAATGILESLKTEGVAQTADEVAEYIVKAMEAEKPHARYITNKHGEDFVKKKHIDLTGDTTFEIITQQFFGTVSTE